MPKGGGAGGTYGWLFTINWRTAITLVFVGLFLGGALVDSMRERSWIPFVYKVGGRVTGGDEIVHHELQKVIDNPSEVTYLNEERLADKGLFGKAWEYIKFFVERLWSIILIFGGLWLIYVVLSYLAAGINFVTNLSHPSFGYLYALVILALLQIIFVLLTYSSVNDGQQFNDLSMANKTSALTPYKGIGYLIANFDKFYDYMTNTLSNPITTTKVDNESLNKTIEINNTEIIGII